MIEYLVSAFVAGAFSTAVGFFLGIKYSAKGWIEVIGKLNDHYTEQLLLVLKMPIHMAESDGEPCPDCGKIHDDGQSDDHEPEGESN